MAASTMSVCSSDLSYGSRVCQPGSWDSCPDCSWQVDDCPESCCQPPCCAPSCCQPSCCAPAPRLTLLCTPVSCVSSPCCQSVCTSSCTPSCCQQSSCQSDCSSCSPCQPSCCVSLCCKPVCCKPVCSGASSSCCQQSSCEPSCCSSSPCQQSCCEPSCCSSSPCQPSCCVSLCCKPVCCVPVCSGASSSCCQQSSCQSDCCSSSPCQPSCCVPVCCKPVCCYRPSSCVSLLCRPVCRPACCVPASSCCASSCQPNCCRPASCVSLLCRPTCSRPACRGVSLGQRTRGALAHSGPLCLEPLPLWWAVLSLGSLAAPRVACPLGVGGLPCPPPACPCSAAPCAGPPAACPPPPAVPPPASPTAAARPPACPCSAAPPAPARPAVDARRPGTLWTSLPGAPAPLVGSAEPGQPGGPPCGVPSGRGRSALPSSCPLEGVTVSKGRQQRPPWRPTCTSGQWWELGRGVEWADLGTWSESRVTAPAGLLSPPLPALCVCPHLAPLSVLLQDPRSLDSPPGSSAHSPSPEWPFLPKSNKPRGPDPPRKLPSVLSGDLTVASVHSVPAPSPSWVSGGTSEASGCPAGSGSRTSSHEIRGPPDRRRLELQVPGRGEAAAPADPTGWAGVLAGPAWEDSPGSPYLASVSPTLQAGASGLEFCPFLPPRPSGLANLPGQRGRGGRAALELAQGSGPREEEPDPGPVSPGGKRRLPCPHLQWSPAFQPVTKWPRSRGVSRGLWPLMGQARGVTLGHWPSECPGPRLTPPVPSPPEKPPELAPGGPGGPAKTRGPLGPSSEPPSQPPATLGDIFTLVISADNWPSDLTNRRPEWNPGDVLLRTDDSCLPLAVLETRGRALATPVWGAQVLGRQDGEPPGLLPSKPSPWAGEWAQLDELPWPSVQRLAWVGGAALSLGSEGLLVPWHRVDTVALPLPVVSQPGPAAGLPAPLGEMQERERVSSLEPEAFSPSARHRRDLWPAACPPRPPARPLHSRLPLTSAPVCKRPPWAPGSLLTSVLGNPCARAILETSRSCALCSLYIYQVKGGRIVGQGCRAVSGQHGPSAQLRAAGIEPRWSCEPCDGCWAV
ncbi:Hypothetical predicted protein [Marmota monax]|uniref:Uncharacterized protein n=1 Tax=Marmota monax TaxID=9995 RepID=A0A5E4D030_MARMO|nr:Hypothetical predicted protein [Marmota monax]